MDNIKLMYITNRPEIAVIAENAGVDRIFVDMEYIGKELRQGGMDTVQSHHTLDDVRKIRQTVRQAELLVRCNPIHDKTSLYGDSREEIEGILENKPDIIMLPYFKTVEEVETFIRLVDGRAKTLPLMETREAVEKIDEILQIDGIDEIYVGLNDLSISYGHRFMFHPLADGTVDRLAEKFHAKGMPFGFGGLASLNKGLLPGCYVLTEHYRLGSSSVILSRAFCNADKAESQKWVRDVFGVGIAQIRKMEQQLKLGGVDYEENHRMVQEIVGEILETMV